MGATILFSIYTPFCGEEGIVRDLEGICAEGGIFDVTKNELERGRVRNCMKIDCNWVDVISILYVGKNEETVKVGWGWVGISTSVHMKWV